jgi:hypothetical protein
VYSIPENSMYILSQVHIDMMFRPSIFKASIAMYVVASPVKVDGQICVLDI